MSCLNIPSRLAKPGTAQVAIREHRVERRGVPGQFFDLLFEKGALGFRVEALGVAPHHEHAPARAVAAFDDAVFAFRVLPSADALHVEAEQPVECLEQIYDTRLRAVVGEHFERVAKRVVEPRRLEH